MSKRAIIRVIEPGMLTTVQDLGRTGWSSVGVGRGGAADTLSLRIGNRILGNDEGAAGLEITMTGGIIAFEADTSIALTGGDASAHIEGRGGDRPVVRWTPVHVQAGERLVIGPIRTGVRAYLLVAGGIAVPRLLDSRSTHLVGGFGGMNGRPLSSSDQLEIGGSDQDGEKILSAHARTFCDAHLFRRTVRAIVGAHHDTFSARAAESFWNSAFRVSVQSNRTGLRLNGQIEPSRLGGRMPSEGMMAGAVQVPASGAPIVLMVDYPTTGGYPVIACVAAVDLPVLGQARPRQSLRFERIGVEEARALYAEQERMLNAEVPTR